MNSWINIIYIVKYMKQTLPVLAHFEKSSDEIASNICNHKQ